MLSSPSTRSRGTASAASVTALSAGLALFASAALPAQGPPRLLGWNDLGMHCMDNDMSVFSILPPFNTFHAQLVIGGQLADTGSYSLTYEAVADPTGSINTTSIGKTDFWQHEFELFGVQLQPDEGLRGYRMPGSQNIPQSMTFDSGIADYVAEGVPMTPYDDQGRLRPYSLMRLVARDGSGTAVASTDIVVPVSAEMACLSCHASGSNPAARPSSGWQYGPASIDDRLNILALHDDRFLGSSLYTQSLQAVGYSSLGLLDTAVNQQTAVLCANCHGSVALDAPGQPGVPSLTSAIHTVHGEARLPDGKRLDDVADRSSCYTCHPGAATRCLRGAMGKAIDANGEAMMACQDCHGSMSQVGDPNRTGWLDEPNCQACHTGDALQNAGAIRFDNAFDAPGHLRQPTNTRFATDPNTPSAGHSLYRFSVGHGDLECSACHGSPHSIWPASEDNDNLQSLAAQGHKGVIAECTACHSGLGQNDYNGPHGMHPVGDQWVDDHGDVTETIGTGSCRRCHGTDYRGTVLSRAFGPRTLNSQFGTRTLWRGYEVGCYECHNGPNSENAVSNGAPVAANRTEATPTDQPLALALSATDPNQDPLTLRIVEQPRHGAVAFDGTTATYRAWDGYVGPDAFTYAASDGSRESNLATVSIAVQPPSCAGSAVGFGYGCAAPDHSVPSLVAEGCPIGGNQVDLRFTSGGASGFAVLALGYGRGTGELAPDGCTLRVGTVLALSPLLALNGGAALHTIAVPPGLGAFDMTAQGFVLDAAAPRGYVGSRGLEVRFR